MIRVSRQLLQELGHDPSAEEIAVEMNGGRAVWEKYPAREQEDKIGKIRDILKIAQEPVSLETPIGEEKTATWATSSRTRTPPNPPRPRASRF